MAAAEYYGDSRPQAAAEYYGDNRPQAPRPQQQQQPIGGLPYPLSDAPPPYTAFLDPRPQYQSHSQPPPDTRLPMHANYTPASGNQYQPPPPNQYPNTNTHQYPPDKHAHTHAHFRLQAYASPNNTAPTTLQADSHNRRTSTPAYRDEYRGDSKTRSRSHSRSRSRSRSRGEQQQQQKHHRHRQHRPERPQSKRNGSGVSTFLGAGGGAVIGDLLFPGLGTIGGALLGGVSGHKFGKERRSYSNDRDYYEENQRRGRRRHEERLEERY